jgi:integrase
MLAVARRGDKRMRRDMEAILLTFLTTGFRLSDVTGLLKSDVDLAAGQIVRRTLKRGKTVALELHPELRLALMKRPPENDAQRQSPFLFSSKRGKPIQNLDGILRALWRRCGIERGHAHKFRDTFSVRLLERGASLYDVAQYLGITMAVCERHYAPYVRELRDRGRRLVAGMAIQSPRAEGHLEHSNSLIATK